jgi:hypothetical protein
MAQEAVTRPWRQNLEDETWWNSAPVVLRYLALNKQSPCRAAVIDFKHDQKFTQLDKPLDLYQWLTNCKEGYQRWIILEDLSYDWVEILGSEVGPSHSFFALHMEDPLPHDTEGVRVPLGQDPSYNFILSYTEVQDKYIKYEQGPFVSIR